MWLTFLAGSRRRFDRLGHVAGRPGSQFDDLNYRILYGNWPDVHTRTRRRQRQAVIEAFLWGVAAGATILFGMIQALSWIW